MKEQCNCICSTEHAYLYINIYLGLRTYNKLVAESLGKGRFRYIHLSARLKEVLKKGRKRQVIGINKCVSKDEGEGSV